MNCRYCNKPLIVNTKYTTAGWMLIVAGIILAPVCVGLIFIFIGLNQKETFMVCRHHGRQ